MFNREEYLQKRKERIERDWAENPDRFKFWVSKVEHVKDERSVSGVQKFWNGKEWSGKPYNFGSVEEARANLVSGGTIEVVRR